VEPGGETIAELRAHRKRQVAERLALGLAYEDHGLVFWGENGEPIRPRFLTNAALVFGTVPAAFPEPRE